MLHNFPKFIFREARNLQPIISDLNNLLDEVYSEVFFNRDVSVIVAYITGFETLNLKSLGLQHDAPQIVSSDRSSVKLNDFEQTPQSQFLTCSYHLHKVEESPGHEDVSMIYIADWLHQVAVCLKWQVEHSPD